MAKRAVPRPKVLTPSVLPDIPVGTARGASEAGYHQIEAKLLCPKMFQFKHVRGIVTPSIMTPDYLAVGSLFHAGRARWFSKRFDCSQKTWEAIAEAVATEAQAMDPPCSAKAEAEALKLLHLYVDHWSRRVAPTPLVAEYEVGPASLLEGDAFSFRTARLDDVTEYDVGLCVGEAKTTSVSIQDAINQYTLHGQPLLQVLLWKRAPQGERLHGPVKGVMLDIVKKPDNKGKGAKFARHFLPVTDHALAWFAKNLAHDVREAASIEWDTDVRRNTTSCTRQIGRMRVACPYRELCAHGKSATANYTFKNGKSLLTWKPEDGKQVPPWI